MKASAILRVQLSMVWSIISARSHGSQRIQVFLPSNQDSRDLLNDDRHNPNINTRNATNSPALPNFTSRPSKRPTIRPTRKPTVRPTSRPTAKPTRRPSPKPSLRPTVRPTGRPSSRPTARPTRRPTASPSARPSVKPTVLPTQKPTARPSSQPTARPTRRPTASPSARPTVKPTVLPTKRPTARPSSQPTARQTGRPSSRPTARPTRSPTASPSARPSVKPTVLPTQKPTARPSSQPTARPTGRPSSRPTARPTRRPTASPSARPSVKPTVLPTKRPTARPSSQPTARPTRRPTASPSARPTVKPTVLPTKRPTARPSSQPTARPTGRPSSRPTARPTRSPTASPSARPSVKPTVLPTQKPTARPSSQPTVRPTGRPSSRPSARPTVKPTNLPTATPTLRPTAQPTVEPTLSPTFNLCVREHYGKFGNSSSSNVILVSYDYELVTNITILALENTTTADVAQDVEYAITDLLLKSLFAECEVYYQGSKKRLMSGQRELASGQVVGINAMPNDIITGESCNASATIPSSDNIFSSNVESSNAFSCDKLHGQLAIFVDDSLMKDSISLESLYNMTRALIKEGMDSDVLASMSNDAIVQLRFVDEPVKDPLPSVVTVLASSVEKNDIIQWSLVGLAILAVLLSLLATGRFVKRKRKKKEMSIFHNLEDEKSVNSPVYDFEGLSETDISQTQPSNGSLGSMQKAKTDISASSTNVPWTMKTFIPPAYCLSDLNFSASPDLDEIDDFMEQRFKTNHEMDYDELVLPDIVPLSRVETNKICITANGSLRSASQRPSIDHDEENYTYEAMGTNRGVTPKCSICFKNADGLMRRCQCGKSSCDKIAHASCIYGRNPTPSISYPGTPPPMLAPVLCGSESRGQRRRSQSYDEEKSLALGLSKSMSFDDSVSAQENIRNGVMGCVGCR